MRVMRVARHAASLTQAFEASRDSSEINSSHRDRWHVVLGNTIMYEKYCTDTLVCRFDAKNKMVGNPAGKNRKARATTYSYH